MTTTGKAEKEETLYHKVRKLCMDNNTVMMADSTSIILI